MIRGISQLEPFEKHIQIKDSEQTLVGSLIDNCPQISHQKIKLALKYGAVWLTTQRKKATRIRRAKKILSIGDEVHLYYNESILFSEISQARLIADEGEYSVWNKPCGMFSQGTKWGDHHSIARWVELFGLEKYNLKLRPTFLVHRLDRATSGLIIVAHSKKMSSRLAQLFETRQVKKHYTASVHGDFSNSLVSKIIDEEIDGKKATTIILSSSHEPENNLSNLTLEIKTGRKHQIRKHLSMLGYPIIGDRLYGNTLISQETSDLMLTSHLLEFECPIDQLLRTYTIN